MQTGSCELYEKNLTIVKIFVFVWTWKSRLCDRIDDENSKHSCKADTTYSGAPNDGFLPNALKRCFRLSGVFLKLCRLILGWAIKFLSVRFF